MRDSKKKKKKGWADTFFGVDESTGENEFGGGKPKKKRWRLSGKSPLSKKTTWQRKLGKTVKTNHRGDSPRTHPFPPIPSSAPKYPCRDITWVDSPPFTGLTVLTVFDRLCHHPHGPHQIRAFIFLGGFLEGGLLNGGREGCLCQSINDGATQPATQPQSRSATQRRRRTAVISFNQLDTVCRKIRTNSRVFLSQHQKLC